MPLIATDPLTPDQLRLLRALFAEGGLTTKQLEQYITADLDPRVTRRYLDRLRTSGFVISHDLGTKNGDLCWTITYAGAKALKQPVAYTDARYRLPSFAQLDYKTLTLRLSATLAYLNWTYHKPLEYSSSRRKPEDTPQRQALAVAVGSHFTQHARNPAVHCLHPDQVPGGINDWVAWPSAHPTQAAVLIVPPEGVSLHFWGSYKTKSASSESSTKPGRLQLYQPLMGILPIFAIFGDAETARNYAPRLEIVGMPAITPEELPGFLRSAQP